MVNCLRLAAVAIFSFMLLASSGSALLAFMDNNVYQAGEDIIFKVNRTANVNITGEIYNSTLALDFTIPNGSAGLVEYELASPALAEDEYSVVLTEDADSVKLKFRVVTELLKPVTKIMGEFNPTWAHTGILILNQTGNIPGANFSELLKLNLSDGVFYGNITNMTGDGRNFYFVTVDDKKAGSYDTVFIDDDNVFQLFNDSEDNGSKSMPETMKRRGEIFQIDSSHRYVVVDISKSYYGNDIYLTTPLESPVFTASDVIYMLVMVTDKNGDAKANKTVNLTVVDKDKVRVDAPDSNQIVEIGEGASASVFFNLTYYAAGKYFVIANDTLVDVFRVESFKLHGKATDLNDNPSYSFSPGSKAKLWVISRNADGDLMDLDGAPSGVLKKPDGSSSALTLSAKAGSTGVYTAETSALSATGEYKVLITGTKGSYTENAELVLKVETIAMSVMTLNAKYIEEMMMVNAFPNPSNITIAVFFINKSVPVPMAEGPPCMGESCVSVDCSDYSQFSVSVRDESGRKWKLSGTAPGYVGYSLTPVFTTMTINELAASMGFPPPAEEGIGDQCIVFLWWGNYSYTFAEGTYKVEVGFTNPSLGSIMAGDNYKIQRLIAEGSTVDMKGDSFSFLAPNSTARVKVEIRDMLTDQLLTTDKILNAKFTSMWKEWPERKNAMTEMANFSKALLNESMDGDKIVFTTPTEEGFYTAEFRFKANLSGNLTEGTGKIFFELKKYMIWANLMSVGENNWFVKVGDNVTLGVTIMDIDMGSQYGSGGSSASCTGCAGLIATVGELRNEQFFKVMKEGVDYTVEKGVVTNSTSGASMKILSKNLPPGWYGMDVKLYRPSTNETFYGWGGFEIRNFWVEVFNVEEITEGPDAGNYTRAEGQGQGKGGDLTVPVGGNVLIGVAAYSPPGPMSPPIPLQVTDVDVEGLFDDMSWPPVPIASGMFSAPDLGGESMKQCWGENCKVFQFHLLNLSVSGNMKESSYRLNLKVTAQGGGTDVGSAQIMVSSYVVQMMPVPPSKLFEFPPVYANSEDLTLFFNATDFGYNPHNILNVTVRELFNQNEGRPMKIRWGSNYTNDCTGTDQSCVFTLGLSDFSAGKYFMMLSITDDMGSSQYQQYEFEIRNLLFSVPQIYEGWTMDYSTPEKDVDAWYGEDSCDNRIRLEMDQSMGTPTNKVLTYELGNITIPDMKNQSALYYWARMCIMMQDGRWIPASALTDMCPGNNFVFIVNNGTAIWANETQDMTNSTALGTGGTFQFPTKYPGMQWEIYEIRQDDPQNIRIKYNDRICGRNDMGIGGEGFFRVVPPAGHDDYSSFYHGPVMIVGYFGGGQDWMTQMLSIPNRSAYVYHNTTHLWLFPSLSGDINLSNSSVAKGPYSPGQIVDDGNGGLWKLVSLSKSQISLRGENILANGIMVDTSLSSSGYIYIGQLMEEMTGFKDKSSGEQFGLDLDGDGNTTGTFFFLVMDDGTGYNKLAYSDPSQPWNFTNSSRIVSTAEANRLNRQVGLDDRLTLLSIDPRARSIKFYDPIAMGEWAEIGDSRVGDNLTIPVAVKSPNGSSVLANVSITHLKLKTDEGVKMVAVNMPAVLIDGIGELRVNVSALNFSAGRYEFELKADNDALGEEKLNEWMWPRSVVRNFLMDGTSGYGGLVTDFVQVDVQSFGTWWGSQCKVRNLFTVNNPQQGNVTGVLEALQHEVDPYSPSCPNYTDPASATPGYNKTFVLDRLDGQYFAFATEGNPGKVWIKAGDCNFSVAPNYTSGSPINITMGTDIYKLYVLNATINNIIIGLRNFSVPNPMPLRWDTWGQNQIGTWALMSMNLSGTVYNVVFANETWDYPQAAMWGVQEISKVIFVDTDGDFSDARELAIGDTVSGNKYLARVGPGPWDGILIADNGSLASIGISAKPGMDVRIQDGTPAYFGVISESDGNLMTDLNLDGDMDDVFYLVATDDYGNGLRNLTKMFIDDDLNITEEYWSNSTNPQQDMEQGNEVLSYDFYGPETGMPEQWGNPPKGMWGGNVRFAPRNESVPWEESAEWQVRLYNGTSMMLEKNVWKLEADRTITLTLKVFDFAQMPIVMANVSLVKLMRYGGGQPYAELTSPEDFTLVETQKVTDDKGYAMLKLVPPVGDWEQAEYIAALKAEIGTKSEIIEIWFRIGDLGGFK